MEQYILKSTIVAEIKKLKGKISNGSSYCNGWQRALRMLKLSLDTINTKEMDLDEETLHSELRKIYASVYDSKDIEAAKHFFELGLNASNPLTWEDIKQICDIAFEEACRLQRNMKGCLVYKEQHYQVLNVWESFYKN